MPGTENSGYLVQLQSPEGDNLYPIISAEMIKDAEGNTYNLSSMKESVDGMGNTYATKTELSSVSSTVSELSSDVQECFQSVSEGKSAIASAITDKGVSTAADATFQQMSENIENIETVTPVDLAMRNVKLTFSNFTENPVMTKIHGPDTMYYTASMDFPPGKAMNLNLVPSSSGCTVQYRNGTYGNAACRLVPKFTGTTLNNMECFYTGGSSGGINYASFSVESVQKETDGIIVTLKVSTSGTYTSFDANNKTSSVENLVIKISGQYNAYISTDNIVLYL